MSIRTFTEEFSNIDPVFLPLDAFVELESDLVERTVDWEESRPGIVEWPCELYFPPQTKGHNDHVLGDPGC